MLSDSKMLKVSGIQNFFDKPLRLVKQDRLFARVLQYETVTQYLNLFAFDRGKLLLIINIMSYK